MNGLPKKYAKMGFKKGWREYKKSKRGTKKRSVSNMAKKKTYRKKSNNMFGKLNQPIMGGAGVVLYESFISPRIPLNGVAKDMLELAGGLYLSKKKGFLGATGKSLLTINSYQLISGLVAPQLVKLVNVPIQNTYTY
jgi:hypothetical protein